MCRKFEFKERSVRNTERRMDTLNRSFRKGWRDSYRDTTGPWFDRTVIGMFMIGSVATAIGLI
jgi:hypothetical protein